MLRVVGAAQRRVSQGAVLKEARWLSSAGGKRPRLVVLGSGWASFTLLNGIDGKKYDIAVVSPRNHLLFTPMLPSSALGTVNQRSICQPVRPVVAHKNGNYYESKATAIDREHKTVSCLSPKGSEYKLSYDKLVVGVGYQPNDFGIPGVKEHAMFMKETSDATVFKDHVLEKLEQASYIPALDSDLRLNPEEEAKIRETLTFIIVGGGPTGVELAGELTDFLNAEGKKQYGHLQKYMSVHMFTYDLLNMFDQGMQDFAITHLKKKQGVDIHLGALVQKVDKDTLHVKTGDGETMALKYGTLVWCAGIKPWPFVKEFGFPMDKRGAQILVDKFLRVKGEEDIYAIGDCATIEDYWLPQTAQVAKQQANYLSSSFNKQGSGQLVPFKFVSLGMMAYLGGFNAVIAKLPGIPANFTGMLAFLGWRSAYWSLQLSIRNRYMLSTDWLRTLIFGRDLTRFGPPSRPV